MSAPQRQPLLRVGDEVYVVENRRTEKTVQCWMCHGERQLRLYRLDGTPVTHPGEETVFTRPCKLCHHTGIITEYGPDAWRVRHTTLWSVREEDDGHDSVHVRYMAHEDGRLVCKVFFPDRVFLTEDEAIACAAALTEEDPRP
jgi:hypothetical protein